MKIGQRMPDFHGVLAVGGPFHARQSRSARIASLSRPARRQGDYRSCTSTKGGVVGSRRPTGR